VPPDLILLANIVYLNLVTDVFIDTGPDVFPLDKLYSIIFTVVTYGKTIIVSFKELVS